MKSLGEEMLLSDTLGNQKNQFSTLVEILQQRASSEPAKIAYTYLANGETPEDRLTYQQLDYKAKAIAAYLQSCISPGDRVLLIYPQGLEFIAAFFGCLYAGVIAIPTPAPEASNLKRLLPRLLSIIEDSKAAAILTTTSLQSQLISRFAEFENNQQIPWYATDTIAEKLSEKWSEPVINTDTIAYLQYTSGSTYTPKGVILTHKNLICHLADLQQASGYDNNSITVTWMPYFHDYGLVEGLLQPLYNGTPCYLMSPFAFIKKPFSWLQAISRYKATHSQAPNFAYDYCVQRITPEQRDKLDLSSWQAAGNGAEPINPEVIERFCKTFASCGFRFDAFAPGYGLAEATLAVTISRKKESPVFCNFSAEALTKNRIIENSDGKNLASAGRLLLNTKIAIVHPETLTQCAADEIGEIWVTSRGVAQGYWQRPDLTKETFQAYLADTKEGPFLRTGDLGFIKNGELFVTGRLKDLIIIRGENYYPQDIEWIVEKSHPFLRSGGYGAVFSVEMDGSEQIVIVQEIERSVGKNLNLLEEVIAAIRKAVAEELELPVYAIVLLKRGSIPKTSSGKIQRQACRAAFLNGSLDSIDTWRLNSESSREVIELRTELELQLLQIWQKILGIVSISIKDNFFQLGGDSLKAANLVVLVEQILRIKIPLATVMEAPTIEKLALYLQQPNCKRNYHSLVAIRSQGSKRPFFYVDGLGANIVTFTSLERYLDPERPFYVMHPVGLDGDEFPHSTIEEMASHYIKEIQTIQPQSPYLLGGYCMGAMVAFEMAQQLGKQEQIVLQLVMVEGVNPFNLENKTVNKNEQLIKREIEIRNNLIEQGWNLGQVEIFIKIWKAERQAILNYMPKLYAGDVVYFSSEQSQHESIFNPMRQLGWAEFTNGHFEIETVPGNHLSMHLEPNVKILAERLNFHLERAAEKANSKVFLLKQSRLQQIQGDLARSRLKLQHFQAYLEKMFS